MESYVCLQVIGNIFLSTMNSLVCTDLTIFLVEVETIGCFFHSSDSG